MRVAQRRTLAFSITVGGFTRNGEEITVFDLPENASWVNEDGFSEGDTNVYVFSDENSEDDDYKLKMYVEDLQYRGSGYPAQIDEDTDDPADLLREAIAKAKARAKKKNATV